MAQQKPSIADQIVEGLEEFAADLKSGQDIGAKYNTRKLTLAVRPSHYDADRVRATRQALDASQSIFAQFVGASLETVRAWEQGKKTPSGIAARFLDEINRDKPYWQERLKALAINKHRAEIPAR